MKWVLLRIALVVSVTTVISIFVFGGPSASAFLGALVGICIIETIRAAWGRKK